MPKKNDGIVGIIVGGSLPRELTGVIGSATIEAINEGRRVVGIIGGFKSLFSGNLTSSMPLTISDVSMIHAEGGSILRTSRQGQGKI